MTRSDPFDDLAAMFMTAAESGGESADDADDVDSSRDRDASPRSSSRPGGDAACEPVTVDVLLVGHLPVRAALWLTPFADAIARESGTTALVRLDGDEPLVQVLRGDAAGRLGDGRNLRETVLEVGDKVRAWIVRPSLQTTVPELIDGVAGRGPTAPGHSGAVSEDASTMRMRFTILSSADQAAIVNAYRLVKDLVETASRRQVATPEIGLAVIGAEPATASGVAERLSRTTLECLGVDIPLTHCLPQIDSAVRGSALRTFPGRARPELPDVLGWIDEASVQRGPRRAAPTPRAAASETAIASQTGNPDPAHPDPAHQEPPRRSPTIEIPARRPAPRTPESEIISELPVPIESMPGLRAAGTIRLEPKVEAPSSATGERLCEPKRDARRAEPDRDGAPVLLSSYVPELTSLAARCPDHERIELAIDGGGRVHVLCREDALRSLPVVANWVRSHRELLALACPEHSFEPTGRAEHHVFTDEPRTVADLHASNIRLHVLAPVDVDGRIGWYSAPLN